ncbi:MAG: RNA polymerase sigma factor [Chitinophagaceae bacterium]
MSIAPTLQPSYCQDLENLAESLIGNPTQARWIVQKALRQSHQILDRNQPSWLVKVGLFQQVILDCKIWLAPPLDKNQPHGIREIGSDLPSPHQPAPSLQELFAMELTIRNLPHQYKEVLQLYLFAGLTIREIAHQLNHSVSTVQNRKTKGWYLIKNQLGIYCTLLEYRNLIKV